MRERQRRLTGLWPRAQARGNDRAQVEPVGRTVARAAGLESGSTPLEEPDRSNAVAAATTVALSAIVGRQEGLLRPA